MVHHHCPHSGINSWGIPHLQTALNIQNITCHRYPLLKLVKSLFLKTILYFTMDGQSEVVLLAHIEPAELLGQSSLFCCLSQSFLLARWGMRIVVGISLLPKNLDYQ